jgi:light-regulated signal transduction histidine kinase (bacteriophytochrome)
VPAGHDLPVVAEREGLLRELWIPSLIMPVGIAMSTGIASRRNLLGCLASFAYAGALLGAGVMHSHGGNVIGIDDSVGIVLIGCMVTLVASNHAIENTLTMARNEYKGVAELETDFGDLPPVRCHIGELNQAVLNIIINAAHAIGDAVQGTDARGRIRVQTARDGDDAIITIADTGPGIPGDIRDRIFDPFFTTKQVGRGTGQGLAIAHSVIVDKHHGRIDFETELGKGTTFSIRIAIDGCPSAESSDAA